MKTFFVLAVFASLMFSNENIPYYALLQPLKESVKHISAMEDEKFESSEQNLIMNFCQGVEGSLIVGEMLAQSPKVDSQLLESYLKQLRELIKLQAEIYQVYRKSLSQAMKTDNKKRFEKLASLPLEPLQQPRVRLEAVEYYQKNFPKNSIKNLEKLCQDQIVEAKSLQYIMEQEQAYEEHLRILKRSEARGIKRDAKIGSRNSVIVVAEEGKNGEIVFEAENLNPFLVTLSLDFEKLVNLKSLKSLPLYVELPGKSKKEILRLFPQMNGITDYRSSYGWVKGSALARHDDSYIYQLPFAPGTSVKVSQGYDGGLSHKGLSAYAVDFSVPIGTPIYAAREGEVVGLDVSNALGGASPEFRPYMNYINIRHADGTLGNYCHLKQGGAAVKIGDSIKKGQLIAYSGNTGYCTAPHLHFSVGKVDPVSMRRPMNLPIKMQTLQGLVTYPREGERYTVQ